jgi:hypothetical protein
MRRVAGSYGVFDSAAHSARGVRDLPLSVRQVPRRAAVPRTITQSHNRAVQFCSSAFVPLCFCAFVLLSNRVIQ